MSSDEKFPRKDFSRPPKKLTQEKQEKMVQGTVFNPENRDRSIAPENPVTYTESNPLAQQVIEWVANGHYTDEDIKLIMAGLHEILSFRAALKKIKPRMIGLGGPHRVR